MAIYQCSVCGYVFDEEKEGKSFADLKECPVCHQPAGVFRKKEAPRPPEPRGQAGQIEEVNDGSPTRRL